MSPKKALKWVIFWISVALVFNAGVYYFLGQQKAIEFLTGYIIEESLSVDNLFVFLVLFKYFKIPLEYQRRVLNWGIVGVIILRGIFIFLGAALISNFGFVLYIFGAILIYSGYQMAFGKEKEIHPEQNKVLRLFKRFYKVTTDYHGDHFFVKRDGVKYATPLFVCLIVIESTDLVFAIDSIPAIFAITTDPFIVFSSNILAVLGLRSMYFLLSAIADKFEFVKKGVGIILCYVGVKMLVPIAFPGYHIPVFISLIVIISVLVLSVIISIILNKQKAK
ncbi:MAG TPA: TerC family protein [Ignavibacteria bacterium]|nr:tellurium resistance protein TerC [Bacteroidota bacterium]HRE11220.1 TerC family protein [Ignavibacteria bacterium]HRF64704.1 TerC family protein [Ignavibacteria bacterium]HRJ03569.1 TerC family protein [Ignavibacteria bacterium]HRJ84153.1 TerC family protein [Ignavibacteria bacterium]